MVQIVPVLLLVVTAFMFTRFPSEVYPVSYEWKQNLNSSGPFAMNEELRDIELLAKGFVEEPETVTFDSEGNLYAFTDHGNIMQVFPNGTATVWAHIGGRPISGEFDANGDLIVCEVFKGLYRVSKTTREATLLTTRSDDDGKLFNFIDDVTVSSDGKIYFTDASSIVPKRHRNGHLEMMLTSVLDSLEARKTGRLLEYDPKTKKTRTLIDGLFFANGVAVSNDGSFVLVVETFDKRVRRYWLKGEKKGTNEFFTETLPGFLDGISSRPNGNFWVAVPVLDNKFIFPIVSRLPFLKSVVIRLFSSLLLTSTDRMGVIYELNQEGQVIRALYDQGGQKIYSITSVTERDGKLYLGNFRDFIGVKTL